MQPLSPPGSRRDPAYLTNLLQHHETEVSVYLHQGATLVIWLSRTWQHSNQRRIRRGTTYLGTGCNNKSRRGLNLIYILASCCNRLPCPVALFHLCVC
ncbi:hypothetical protein E4T47_09433 [Aureobasidium subglaciale]|nr:hypothetical protein E4T47_09433 [Aureobasidium subglaciale]